MSVVYGIDCGAADCAIVVSRSGDGSGTAERAFTCPSGVAELPDGSLAVGAAAQAARLGRGAAYRGRFKPDFGDPTPVRLGTRRPRPHELAAYVLRELRTMAERHTPDPPDLVAIGVPAAWEQGRRGLLRRAAELAGFDPARTHLVPEPAAAATYAFAPSPSPSPAERTRPGAVAAERLSLVYDLGAGGFRCALVDCGPLPGGGLPTVVGAPDGAADLSAADLDRLILDRFRQRFPEAAARALDGRAGTEQERLNRLLFADACEQAKIRLSAAEAYAMPVGGPDSQAVFQISRGELAAWAGPLLKEAHAACDRMLDALGMGWPDLHHILPVGAACRLGAIVEPLAEHAGRPVETVDEPELAVARGAARWARLTLQQAPPTAADLPFHPDKGPFDRGA